MLEHEPRWAWPGVLSVSVSVLCVSLISLSVSRPSQQADGQAEVEMPGKQTAVRQSPLLEWT